MPPLAPPLATPLDIRGDVRGDIISPRMIYVDLRAAIWSSQWRYIKKDG